MQVMQPLWTSAQLGEYLGITEDAVRKMRRRDAGLRAISLRVGKNVKYRPEDVQAWLNANAEQPAA